MSERIEELLTNLDHRLAKIESRLDCLEHQTKNTLAIFVDAFDENFDPAVRLGRANLEKVDHLKSLIHLATQEETLVALESLISQLGYLAPLISKVKQLDNALSIAVDAADDFFDFAMKEGLDIEKFTENLKEFSLVMTKTFESGTITHLMESGIFDPRSVEVVGALGKSMALSSQSCSRASPLSMLGLIFDSDAQRAMGFLRNFSKARSIAQKRDNWTTQSPLSKCST